MIISKRCKYSKLFVFEADLIFIPSSYNRKGIDPLPKFHIRPTRLIEYQNFSRNASSVNNGYTKNEELNLYVKNIEYVDVDLVNNQFTVLKHRPPYGFATASDYESFVETTFDAKYSAILETKYATLKNKTFVKADPDSLINADHFTAKMEASSIQEFYDDKLVKVGEPKSLTIKNNV